MGLREIKVSECILSSTKHVNTSHGTKLAHATECQIAYVVCHVRIGHVKLGVGVTVKVAGLRSYDLEVEPLSCC